jgi:OFA family oxalate/formate antiporter-like MFS transporter
MHHEVKIGKFRPWIVLGAATAINMTMGVTYSWSLIKKALVTDWQWTNVEASFPLTTYTAVFALAMVFAGRMQDKLGPRLIASLGAVLLGTGLISCSFANTPLSLVLTYGIAGIGNGLCYASTIPASIKWFPPERKGLATGVVVSGIGLASIYISPIANWLLGNWGISKTFLVLGTGAFIIMIISANFLSNPPRNYKPKSKIRGMTVTGNIAGHASCDIDWPEMIRTKLFYKLWFMYLFAASAGLMIIGHIATIAKTQANWENGFYLVIIFAIFNTGGRFMAGLFSDRYGRRNVMLLVFIVQAINLLFFASYITPALLALGTMMTGLCYGSFFALFPLATADFFGMRNFGVNYGLIFLAWGFAGILGPILAGSAVDITGNYFIAYIISAGLSFVVFFLALTIHPLAKHQ